MGEVAHPPQQPARDARRAARAPRDLGRAAPVHADAEQPGAAGDDLFQLLDGVELQAHGNAEAVAQRRLQQALPRRCAHQREGRQVDPHGACRGPLADDEVERAVLHRGVEHFLDHGIQAVDLVDEQDVALLQIGQQRGKVARLGDDRPGRGAKAHAQLARDDLRQRRLAKAGGAEEQHMVHRLAPRTGRFDEDAKVVLRCRLPDELVEHLGPQRRIGVLGLAIGREDGVIGHRKRHPPSSASHAPPWSRHLSFAVQSRISTPSSTPPAKTVMMAITVFMP
jgi:hypothetical protein